MARVYGYMDDETGVFTPVGGGQSGNAYGGNGYAPRRVGYGVEAMYNPGASYSFPRNNVNAQYGPWYGRQSYATRAPYAPNQPYYERVTGSNGRPVTMRFGEYQREQPVAYETMFNSQGVPVRVPVYGSGAPQQTQQVQQSQQPRQPQQPRQQAQSQVRRSTPRVRANPQPVPFVPSGNVQVPPDFYEMSPYYGLNPYNTGYYVPETAAPVNVAAPSYTLPQIQVPQVNPPQMAPADDPMKKAYHRVFGDDLTNINTERFYGWLGREKKKKKKIRDILSGEVKLDQDVLDSFKYTPGERFLRAFTFGKMEDSDVTP